MKRTSWTDWSYNTWRTMRIWNSDNLCRELANELEELRKKTS